MMMRLKEHNVLFYDMIIKSIMSYETRERERVQKTLPNYI